VDSQDCRILRYIQSSYSHGRVSLAAWRPSEQRNSFVLQAAAARGQKQIVFTLLKHGADASQTSGLYHTAPQVTAMEGQTEIVETLLKFGPDVNMQGGIYGNALLATAAVGDLPMPTTPTCSLDT
jgi:ankyrin repeat protein